MGWPWLTAPFGAPSTPSMAALSAPVTGPTGPRSSAASTSTAGLWSSWALNFFSSTHAAVLRTCSAPAHPRGPTTVVVPAAAHYWWDDELSLGSKDICSLNYFVVMLLNYDW